MDDNYWTPRLIEALRDNKYILGNNEKNEGKTAGKVYRIDQNHVALRDSEEAVHHANFLANLLLLNGVRVPQICKVLDLEETVINEFSPNNKDRWFMISRLVKGKTADEILNRSGYSSERDYELGHRMRIEIPRQFKAQMQKLLDLKIYPGGLLDKYSVKADKLIFNKEETQLYLTGYGGWRPILRKKEAEQMYGILKQDKINFI